jgi:hypothetical protein
MATFLPQLLHYQREEKGDVEIGGLNILSCTVNAWK